MYKELTDYRYFPHILCIGFAEPLNDMGKGLSHK